MELGGRRQERGMQGSQGEWPRQKRRSWLSAWGAGWLGGGGGCWRGWWWWWGGGFGEQREVIVAVGFGGEWQRLGLLRVSGGGSGGRGQGRRGCGWRVQHAAVRGGRAVNHLLLREVLHTRLLIPCWEIWKRTEITQYEWRGFLTFQSYITAEMRPNLPRNREVMIHSQKTQLQFWKIHHKSRNVF